MLDLTPYRWYEELRAAEKYRDQFLDDWEEVISHYHGPGYKSSGAPIFEESHDPENHAFEWISLIGTSMTQSNPRTRVHTARQGIARQAALGMQFALNRWIRMVGFKEVNELLVADYGLKYCVAAVFPRPMPGMGGAEGPSRWPSLRRISPRRYNQDPVSVERSEQRWRSHQVIRDKEDVLQEASDHPEAGWNIDAIMSVPENIDVQSVRGPGNDPNIPWHVDRHEISYDEIWVPEFQPDPKKGPDKGYNGAILTLARGETYDSAVGDASWIRPPRPFFGPRWGPYETAGGFVVPDDATPLSPIGATEAQADHLNAVARAVQRAVEDYKRIAIVGNGDPELETIITEGKHGYVYTCNAEDLQRNVVQLELGGLTAQFLAAEDRARQSLDRNSGMPEAMRGNVEGGATATEVNLAASGASNRFGRHIQKFRDLNVRLLRTAAWYLEFDDSMVPIHLGEEAARQLTDEQGQPVEEPVWQPGISKDQKFADFDDYDFEIELFSMEMSSEQQALMAATELDQLILNVGGAMTDPRFLHVDWKEYTQQREQLRGATGVGKLFDFEMARELAAKFLQMGSAPEINAGGKPQPRLNADLAGARPSPTGVSSPGLNRTRKAEGTAKMLGKNGRAPATAQGVQAQ